MWCACVVVTFLLLGQVLADRSPAGTSQMYCGCSYQPDIIISLMKDLINQPVIRSDINEIHSQTVSSIISTP